MKTRRIRKTRRPRRRLTKANYPFRIFLSDRSNFMKPRVVRMVQWSQSRHDAREAHDTARMASSPGDVLVMQDIRNGKGNTCRVASRPWS